MPISLRSLAMTTALAGVLMAPAAKAAVVVVDQSNPSGWVFSNMENSPNVNASGGFVVGPGTTPLGQGSANFVVNDNSSSMVLVNAMGAGTNLSNINALSYSSYRATGSFGVSTMPALQLNIDGNGTDSIVSWQGRLVFEPYLSGGTVQTDVWQTWDPLTTTDGWWFSNGGLATTTGCNMAASCSWTQVLNALPDAQIHSTFGAVLFKAGSGGGIFNGNVDNFTFGTMQGGSTTYDFETVPEPASLALLALGLAGLLGARARRS